MGVSSREPLCTKGESNHEGEEGAEEEDDPGFEKDKVVEEEPAPIEEVKAVGGKKAARKPKVEEKDAPEVLEFYTKWDDEMVNAFKVPVLKPDSTPDWAVKLEDTGRWVTATFSDGSCHKIVGITAATLKKKQAVASTAVSGKNVFFTEKMGEDKISVVLKLQKGRGDLVIITRDTFGGEKKQICQIKVTAYGSDPEEIGGCTTCILESAGLTSFALAGTPRWPGDPWPWEIPRWPGDRWGFKIVRKLWQGPPGGRGTPRPWEIPRPRGILGPPPV